MNSWILTQFDDIIHDESIRFGIDPKVIQAVILTESGGDPWSYRYEPAYSYLVNPRDWAEKLMITLDSEVMLQKSSMGLMHPMGGVCRELGFQGKLSEIFQPRLSLYYGCLKLQKQAQRYGDDPATMYAAYNAGSVMKTPGSMFINQANVDRFARNLADLTK